MKPWIYIIVLGVKALAMIFKLNSSCFRPTMGRVMQNANALKMTAFYCKIASNSVYLAATSVLSRKCIDFILAK
jgi:hypothetical protein